MMQSPSPLTPVPEQHPDPKPKPPAMGFSRPSLLLLAILAYKWDGNLRSESGQCRVLLYDALFDLFPDAYGQRLGRLPRHLEKDSVLRNLRNAGMVAVGPSPAGVNTGQGRTGSIQVTTMGHQHLRRAIKDARYRDELILVRDYYTAGESDDGPVVAVKTAQPKPLVEVLKERAAVVEVIDLEAQPEIAIAPSWDSEPAAERVGWAVLTGAENWHVVNDDMDALADALSDIEEVRAIYPLTVANALPPKA